MTRKLVILILVFLINPAGFGKEPSPRALLGEGFVVRSVDGRVSGNDGNDVWFFEFASDVTDGRVVVAKGTSLQLLPSATLERIIADVNERSAADCRLWGRITKYKGRNFIFPMFFLPLDEIEELQQQQSQSEELPQQKAEPNESPATEKADLEPVINEPNDILSVPQEILNKLDPRRIEKSKRAVGETAKNAVAQPSEEKAGMASRQDSVVVNRTGFISSLRDLYRSERSTQYGFVFDAIGRNIPRESLHLLPCEALERAEHKQSTEPDTLHFKIAGIVTKYKGQKYLLLQRAIRVYGHGNFGG